VSGEELKVSGTFFVTTRNLFRDYVVQLVAIRLDATTVADSRARRAD
jgi:hypothetical protein